jgi:flagellar hook-associated protein 2
MTAVTTTNFLTTLGAGSGIDTKALAQNLANAEIQPQKDAVNAKLTKTQSKISAYGYIKSALSSLKDAFGKIYNASDFNSITPNNSQPNAFGVSSTAASAGSYNIEVSKIALAQRTVTADPGYIDPNAALNGDASNAFDLNLTTGGSTQAIHVTNSTPAGMVSAINDAKLGVTASLINTGSGYKMVVTGDTGAAKSFSLASTATDVAFASTNLQDAQDAAFKVNGLPVTRTSNTVNDVIDGVTLNLYTPTTGSARLDLNRDTTAIKANLTAIVTAYNDLENTLKELGNSKSTIKDVGGSMVGDSLLTTIRNQVRNMVVGNSTTPGTVIKAGRDVGLSVDRTGQLTLDNTKLDNALQNHFDDVVKMFTAGTNNKSVYAVNVGVAGDAFNGIDKMLRSTGIITLQTDSATKQVTKYQDDLTKLDTKLQQTLDRYTKQFSVMDSIVGNSTATRTSLTSTFNAMNNTKN